MTYGFQHCCLQLSGVIGLEWSDMAGIETSKEVSISMHSRAKRITANRVNAAFH